MKFLGLGSVAVNLLAATLVQAAPAAENLMPRQDNPSHPECPTGMSPPIHGSTACGSAGLQLCSRFCGILPQCIGGRCCVCEHERWSCLLDLHRFLAVSASVTTTTNAATLTVNGRYSLRFQSYPIHSESFNVVTLKPDTIMDSLQKKQGQPYLSSQPARPFLAIL